MNESDGSYDYSNGQIALKTLISGINLVNIMEIWEVKYMAMNITSVNYVALFQDYSHICTCLLLTNEGLVCHHFFQVMLQTQNAKFAFNLLKGQWYKKSVDLQEINALDDSLELILGVKVCVE